MTIGSIILCLVISLFLIILCTIIGTILSPENFKYSAFIGGFIGLLISVIIIICVYWYFNSTASGARALKTQRSNFNMGIQRKVTVYDMEGDVIQTYEGKFDIEYDDDRILFDDENGLRHIIYYPTGTVIIDEIN